MDNELSKCDIVMGIQEYSNKEFERLRNIAISLQVERNQLRMENMWLRGDAVGVDYVENLKSDVCALENEIKYYGWKIVRDSRTIGDLEKELDLYHKKYGDINTNKKFDFTTLIKYPEKEKMLYILHQLIDDKKGKDIGIVLAAATYKYKFLTKTPSEKEFRPEFPRIKKCTWKSISKYMPKPLSPTSPLPFDVQDFEIKVEDYFPSRP